MNATRALAAILTLTAASAPAQDNLQDEWRRTVLAKHAAELTERLSNGEVRRVMDMMKQSSSISPSAITHFSDSIHHDLGRILRTRSRGVYVRSYVIIPVHIDCELPSDITSSGLDLMLDAQQRVARFSVSDRDEPATRSKLKPPDSRRLRSYFSVVPTANDPQGQYAALAAQLWERTYPELDRLDHKLTPDFDRQMPPPVTRRYPTRDRCTLSAGSPFDRAYDTASVEADFTTGLSALFDVDYDGLIAISVRFTRMAADEPRDEHRRRFVNETSTKQQLRSSFATKATLLALRRDLLQPLRADDQTEYFDHAEASAAIAASIKSVDTSLVKAELAPVRASYIQLTSTLPKLTPLHIRVTSASEASVAEFNTRQVVRKTDTVAIFNAVIDFMRKYSNASDPAPDIVFSSEPPGATVSILVGDDQRSLRQTLTNHTLPNVWIAKYAGGMVTKGRKPAKFLLDLYNDPSTTVTCTLVSAGDMADSSCKVGSQ